jgi:hypothetical protein
MKSELQKIAQAPGIMAASQTTPDEGTRLEVSEGDGRRWAPVLAAALQVLQSSGEGEIKIALEKQTVVMQRSGDVVIGVVVVKSHPVVKSLKRMIRRAFKRVSDAMSSTAPAPGPGGGFPQVTRPSHGGTPLPPPSSSRDDGKDPGGLPN